MILITKDNYEVELYQSGNGSAPDDQGNQHTNSGSLWARLDNVWQKVMNNRSTMVVKNIIEHSDKIELDSKLGLTS